MSRVDDLLKTFCPNGVEYKTLAELGSIFGGLTGKSKVDFSDGNMRFVSYVNVYKNIAVDVRADDMVRIAPGERQRTIQRGDVLFTGSSETRDEVGMTSVVTDDVREPIYLNSFCMGFRMTDSSMLDPEFAKYLFRAQEMRNQIVRTASGVTRYNVSKARLALVKIPVPPVQVQLEILRVLDLLSSQVAELKNELNAELRARQVQYAYSWKALLSPNAGWRKTTLGAIADVFDGPHATPKKTESGPWYLSISSLVNGRFNLADSAHLEFDQYSAWTRRVTPCVGDTMFSYETRLGQAAYWDRDEPAALGRRMGLLRPKELEVYPRFLTVAYLSPEFQSLIRAKTVFGATVDRIPVANMPNWPISIPVVSEQRRIVAILDEFNALTTDLSTHLHAELNARRKQYEYYRDRLLTFKEAAA